MEDTAQEKVSLRAMMRAGFSGPSNSCRPQRLSLRSKAAARRFLEW